jgi:hypothetical protein
MISRESVDGMVNTLVWETWIHASASLTVDLLHCK